MGNYILWNTTSANTFYDPWTSYQPPRDPWTRMIRKDGKTMATVPHMISSGGISFMARGRMWSVAPDNPNYPVLKNLIESGCMDEPQLIGLTSVYEAIITRGEGRLALVTEGLTLDGEVLPHAWFSVLATQSDLLPVLLARVGDRVTVAGDEDAPDGVYEVSGVDNADPNNRIYLETEEGFFGYVKSSSIKGVEHAA